MPPISRILVRLSLIYFVIGSLAGVLWSVQLVPQPVYYHLLLFGWVTQMIMGVSIWMFPKHPDDPDRPVLLIAMVVLLNVGLIARAAGEMAAMDDGWRTPALVFSAATQWLSAVMYVIVIWTRIRTKQNALA
jgi:hypothetical protein